MLPKSLFVGTVLWEGIYWLWYKLQEQIVNPGPHIQVYCEGRLYITYLMILIKNVCIKKICLLFQIIWGKIMQCQYVLSCMYHVHICNIWLITKVSNIYTEVGFGGYIFQL
jgi:hypothetical protein